MKTLLKLDFKQQDSSEEIHRYLADKLNFPNYYGNNLNALFDCLTDISNETTIKIYGYDSFNHEQNIIMRCLKDAMRENEFLTVEEGVYKKDED